MSAAAPTPLLDTRSYQDLVDEALAVGDVYFRQRCMRKVH